jgi:hypothetical protein
MQQIIENLAYSLFIRPKKLGKTDFNFNHYEKGREEAIS